MVRNDYTHVHKSSLKREISSHLSLKLKVSSLILSLFYASVGIASELQKTDNPVDLQIDKLVNLSDENEKKNFDIVVSPLINKFPDEGIRFGIYNLLSNIPAYKIENFVNDIIHLFKQLAYGQCIELFSILKEGSFEKCCLIIPSLKALNGNEIMNLIKKSRILTEGLNDKTDTYLILDILSKYFPVNDLENFIKFTSSFIYNIPVLVERVHALKYLQEHIPLNNLENLIKYTSPLVDNIPTVFKRLSVLTILNKYILLNDIESFVKFSSPFIKNITNYDTYSTIIFQFQYLYNFLPSLAHSELQSILINIKESSLDQFATVLENSKGIILKKLIDTCPEMKNALYSHCFESLRSLKREIADTTATMITKYSAELGLDINHWLYQEAIIAGTRLAPSDDPRNPFNFYADLQKKRIVPVDLNTLRIPQETTSLFANGENFVFNVSLNPFYLKDLPKQGIMFKDLPSYSKTFLKDMMLALTVRKVSNNIAFMGEVEAITGMGYDVLLAGSMGSPYLEILLNVSGKPTDSVPITASKFISCVAHLLTQPNKLEVGKVFSSREEKFLKMLRYVQACTTEKDEQISSYYNDLPQEAKLKLEIPQGESHQNSQVKAIINMILAEQIEKMFSGTNAYFKNLIGMKPHELVNQVAHQVTYVKSMICDELGLAHDLAFDPHSQETYEEILKKSKQEMLQSFYAHFNPIPLIESLKNELNKLLQKPNNPYFKLLSGLMNPKVFSKAWDFDMGGTVMLTEFGAIHLLQNLKILNVF